MPLRFVDALVGGAVALVASQLTVARDPIAPLIRESRQVFNELASVLEELATALDRHDETARAGRPGPGTASGRRGAAAPDCGVGGWGGAVAPRMATAAARRGPCTRCDDSSGGLRRADAHVLARAGVTFTRLPTTPPPELGAALRSFAAAVRAVDKALTSELVGSGQAARRYTEQAETATLDALRMAGRLLPQGPPLSLIMIVGQLRSTAIDLLRGAGADDVEILGRVDEALGLPPV